MPSPLGTPRFLSLPYCSPRASYAGSFPSLPVPDTHLPPKALRHFPSAWTVLLFLRLILHLRAFSWSHHHSTSWTPPATYDMHRPGHCLSLLPEHEKPAGRECGPFVLHCFIPSHGAGPGLHEPFSKLSPVEGRSFCSECCPEGHQRGPWTSALLLRHKEDPTSTAAPPHSAPRRAGRTRHCLPCCSLVLGPSSLGVGSQTVQAVHSFPMAALTNYH